MWGALKSLNSTCLLLFEGCVTFFMFTRSSLGAVEVSNMELVASGSYLDGYAYIVGVFLRCEEVFAS